MWGFHLGGGLDESEGEGIGLTREDGTVGEIDGLEVGGFRAGVPCEEGA